MGSDTPQINASHRNGSDDFAEVKLHNFYIGLSLALLSSFFIGSSFILKKKGLLKLVVQASPASDHHFAKAPLRAGQGGFGYLKEWLWWTGLLTMATGELCNFAAYGFVPATLVTPLGALSVLISAVMASYFLNEKLNTIGKFGCILTAIGSTMMVIHAPKEGEVKSVADLLFKLQDIEFVLYTIIAIVALFVLVFYMVPRYGNTNVLVYILICSILGSFTVMSCKGISLGLKEMFNHKPTASYAYTFLFALAAMAFIMVQMNYLNKSLDTFNTPIVTTVNYVLFTLFVMIASAVLFKELMNVSFTDFLGCVCGFTTIICALCLIHFFKASGGDQETVSSNLSNVLSSKFNSESEQNHNEHLQSGFTTADQDSETSSYRDLNFKAYLDDEGKTSNAKSERAFFSASYTTAGSASSPSDDLARRTSAYQHQNGADLSKSVSYLPANENVILSCPPLSAPVNSGTNFTFLKRLAQTYKPLGKNILSFASNVTSANRSPVSAYDSYSYYKLATNETDSLGGYEDSPSMPTRATRSSSNAQSPRTAAGELVVPVANRASSNRDNEPPLITRADNNNYLELDINDDEEDEDENVEFSMLSRGGKPLSAKNSRSSPKNGLNIFS